MWDGCEPRGRGEPCVLPSPAGNGTGHTTLTCCIDNANRPSIVHKSGKRVESHHSCTLSPFVKGGEGWGEGGFNTHFRS
jgi:hypothetical protein